ncbi:Bax inhibitor-1/YccA family membrane protein [Staphylococcus saprophyticus]|uniref:Bax inhibitor-1/YccA family membrane protein n=1 Tax=Staphylococcus saprophyticus TaxID=29385 RepID=UPI0022EA8E19|nr:Bax inhibitor-1/YccA family protein [Staphylococcus saprophyticus]
MDKFIHDKKLGKGRKKIDNIIPMERTMTAAGALWRALILFVILHLAALAGIFSTVAPVLKDVTAIPWVTGLIGSIIMGIVLASRKTLSIPLIVTFTVCEGWFLGGLATYFESVYPGIILQATFAVLSAVVAFLPLFAIKSVRVARRYLQIFLVALGGYLVFVLHNIALMGKDFLPEHIAWGKGAATVAGLSLGLIIAFIVVLMAAYALVITFERIERDVYKGFPRKYAWVSALRVMVTIVWYYVEAPRALLFQRNDP